MDFVDKIKLYKDDKDLLEKWGKNARKLSETTFDKAILSSKVADVIEKAAK